MILVMDNNKKVDYNDIDTGCLIVFEDTFWSVLEYLDLEDNIYALISLRTNEILKCFATLKELKDYIRGTSVIEILKPNTFTLNIIRGE